MTLVVNLFGAPGSGKSTTAAHVFALLKYRGINCELVQEYAKELCWQGTLLGRDQWSIFEEQWHRTNRLLDMVDVVITDSPCELSYVYSMENGANIVAAHNYLEMADRQYRDTEHSRLNVGISRSKPFNPLGRLQSEFESDLLADKILKEPKFNISFNINGSEVGASKLMSRILMEIGVDTTC